jgi:hypothetical protein
MTDESTVSRGPAAAFGPGRSDLGANDSKVSQSLHEAGIQTDNRAGRERGCQSDHLEPFFILKAARSSGCGILHVLARMVDASLRVDAWLPAFPAATAARALGFGTSFIDIQCPPFHILAI